MEAGKEEGEKHIIPWGEGEMISIESALENKTDLLTATMLR